ncbi:MAG: exopolyphosphatase [Burkholderiales bacterium RIFCSPLOWO2_02_FULL_57_36]|nr:MAG: exopolyphosphatase [Burkholderiales bacterium RIFCSPLOWO2_02_FULL_57_36]
MFAAIDLGSNSFRLHIGQHDGDAMRIVKSARDPIRLGAGLDEDGYLTEKAMQTSAESLERFAGILDNYSLDAIRVVATNTLRIAKNSAQLLPALEKAIGYPIEIISGEEEGRLIYMGVASALAGANERRLVIDIGGGSTELILGKGYDIEQVESFTIGTVSHSASFFIGGSIDARSFNAAILSARSRFEDAASMYLPKFWSTAYGSSGTMRAIGDAIAKNALGDGELSMKSLNALKERLIAFGDVSRIDLAGIKPDRAASVAGGLAILIGVMQELGIKQMTSIDAGLRMGVLRDLQMRATRRDRRERSVRDFMQRFHVDDARAERVASLATSLYAKLQSETGAYHKVLYWSALLHEVGLTVSHSGYHKHGAYLVENADLSGFTTREQQTMSMLILGQKGNLKKLGGTLADADLTGAVLALRLAVMFMHSRIDGPLDGIRLTLKNRIDLEIKRDWFSDHPTLAYWIGNEKSIWDQAGIGFSVTQS